MRLMIVADTRDGLSKWGDKIARAAKSCAGFKAEVAGVLSEALLGNVAEADTVILAPDLSPRAAPLARRVKELMPSARVIVYLTDLLFGAGGFVPLREGDVAKVLPESAADEELRYELNFLCSGAGTGRTKFADAGVIAGLYEVVKCLGAGSMGMVYLCRHRELAGHMVAVKVLFPEVVQDKIAAQRFRNEIFAAYGVSHQNVVRAYEYLRDGDLVAYTMEYVDGGDLAERLISQGQLPISEALRMLKQICAGVQAIHDAGIIHRNLKPENILLTKDGTVKVADFCCAISSGVGAKLNEDGTAVSGSIDYVAPEYLKSSQVDLRTDVYGIGLMGYEMLTGASPFRGASVHACMTARLKSDLAPPSTLRSGIPPEVDRSVLKAIARNPDERYQSAAAMYADLGVVRL